MTLPDNLLKVIYTVVLILSFALILYELYMVLKRNRKILVKGNDDYLTLMIITAFAMILLAPRENYETMTAFSSSAVLVALLASLSVKRGISERGIEKFVSFAKWDNIENIRILQPGLSKLRVDAFTKDGKCVTLYYSISKLKSLLYELQIHDLEIMMEKDIKI